ncbi:MAG: RDD family protein [Oligoflexia bacterium]|nr:RDD family protein [Oligoflexia bacterium]
MNKTVSLYARTVAFGIDLFVVAFLQLTIGFALLEGYEWACFQLGHKPDFEMELFLSQFCGGFFFLGYFTLSVGLFGNTLGKNLLGLVIIKNSTGKRLSLIDSYWRSLAYLLSSWTYMVGFMLPWFRKDKRALHDLVCDTQLARASAIAYEKRLQLELPLKTGFPLTQTPTTQDDHSLGRTGNDR